MKIIHDNILGPIELESKLVDIIDTPVFQRLRRLEQLGTASLVFPGARHTRFEHSLGAQEIMRRVLNQLGPPSKNGAISPRDAKVLRAAALVHDIGHYPLSHVIEGVVDAIESHAEAGTAQIGIEETEPRPDRATPISINDPSWWLQIASPGIKVSRESLAHHESLSTYILKSDPQLRCAIHNYVGCGDAVERVIEVLEKQALEIYQRQLVSSELDVDRLDYLVRDSYYTGARFGTVEVDHLIRRMSLYKRDSSSPTTVVVDERALPHLEHYLLARNFMYGQVAYHKAVTAFSVLAGAVWIALSQACVKPTSVAAICESIDNGEYGSFDDTWFWQQVAKLASTGEGLGAKLATDLIERRPPVLVLELRQRGNEKLGDAKYRFEKRRREFTDGSNLDPEHVFLTYQTIQIATEGSKQEYDDIMNRDGNQIPTDTPYVMRRDGEVLPATGVDNSIAQRLCSYKDREQIVRVYCLQRPDLECGEFWQRRDELARLCMDEFRI